jgi:NAD(P)-dependent dehydrogenase (short-subunit alcohol dehydrogenase family)
MLRNDGLYKVFRPDVDSPTREDAEIAFPAMQAIPVPYIEPQDVSNSVVFLASDDSRHITGTQLRGGAANTCRTTCYATASDRPDQNTRGDQ